MSRNYMDRFIDGITHDGKMLGARERADVDVPAPRVAETQPARGRDELLEKAVALLDRPPSPMSPAK